MLTPQDMEKAKNIQLGLAQFERTHIPEWTEDNNGNQILICPQCTVDFPCDRMLTFMLLQAITAFSSMIPSGNMAGIMQRFSGKK